MGIVFQPVVNCRDKLSLNYPITNSFRVPSKCSSSQSVLDWFNILAAVYLTSTGRFPSPYSGLTLLAFRIVHHDLKCVHILRLGVPVLASSRLEGVEDSDP